MFGNACEVKANEGPWAGSVFLLVLTRDGGQLVVWQSNLTHAHAPNPME